MLTFQYITHVPVAVAAAASAGIAEVAEEAMAAVEQAPCAHVLSFSTPNLHILQAVVSISDSSQTRVLRFRPLPFSTLESAHLLGHLAPRPIQNSASKLARVFLTRNIGWKSAATCCILLYKTNQEFSRRSASNKCFMPRFWTGMPIQDRLSISLTDPLVFRESLMLRAFSISATPRARAQADATSSAIFFKNTAINNTLVDTALLISLPGGISNPFTCRLFQ